jgi:hypothetical protein
VHPRPPVGRPCGGSRYGARRLASAAPGGAYPARPPAHLPLPVSNATVHLPLSSSPASPSSLCSTGHRNPPPPVRPHRLPEPSPPPPPPRSVPTDRRRFLRPQPSPRRSPPPAAAALRGTAARRLAPLASAAGEHHRCAVLLARAPPPPVRAPCRFSACWPPQCRAARVRRSAGVHWPCSW